MEVVPGWACLERDSPGFVVCTFKARRGKKRKMEGIKEPALTAKIYGPSAYILSRPAGVFLACKHVRKMLLTYSQQRLRSTVT